MRKKSQKCCDDLCTPIAKKLSEKCILCNAPTEVGHHYVHKSKSLALRYDPENIIPLCCKCHYKLHYNESFYGGLIRQMRGEKWFKYLEAKKQITTKYINYDNIHKQIMEFLNS